MLKSLSSLPANATVNAGTVILTGALPNPSNRGLISYNALGFTDNGLLEDYTVSSNNYVQILVQNSSNGTLASADYVVINDLGTATTFFGDFGMNSSGFAGTGAFNKGNAVFLTATSGDLSIGTTTANAVHFLANSATTDAITIQSNNAVQILGTTTNDNAPAGIVGEYISSSVAIGSPVSMVTGNTVNMTSIALTPGDWDVSLMASFINTGTTANLYAASISLVSATIDLTLGRFGQLPFSVAGNSNVVSIGIPSARISISANTTVYATQSATFTIGTVGAFGRLSARRVR
jgi:hypothetical protein